MIGGARHVVHAVRSDSFAGVERYVCDVGSELSRRGWRVRVVGGDPAAMRRALPPQVEHRAARTTAQVHRALVAMRPAPLVHAHMTAADVAAVLARPLTGGRVVSTRHFAGPRGRRGPVRAVGGLLERGLSLQIAISRFVAAGADGTTVVLLNGVPDAPDRVEVESRSVLVMQRLQAEKDTATALRAFAASGLAADGWRVQVAGRGPLEGDLRRLAEGLSVAGSVDFLGFVDRPTSVRADAAVLLAPAPAEPFGLSVLEAMAEGLPVLAADGGAHAEVVGDSGVLFPPGDVDTCAHLLRRLAADASERRRLGQAGQRRQREHLGLDRHVDELERLYRQVAR